MIIMLQAKTNEELSAITPAASTAINAAGASLINVKQFSNIAMSYVVEIPATSFQRLRRELNAVNIVLDPPSANELRVSNGSSSEYVVASLKLAFCHKSLDKPFLDLATSC